MGAIDNEDKWLDEFVQRHSLRSSLQEDVRQEQWHDAKQGPDMNDTAIYVAGYALGVFLAYVILVCMVLTVTLATGVFLISLLF